MDRLTELQQRFAQEPLIKTLGASLRIIAEGRVEIVMPVSEPLTIVGGAAQGGVIAALADYAAVYAAMTLIPAGHTPAVDISLKLFRPSLIGEVLVAAAEVVHEGRNLMTAEVRVFDRDRADKLKALATIMFAKPK